MLARPVLSLQFGDYPLQNDVGIHSTSGMVVPLARDRHEMALGGQASQGSVLISIYKTALYPKHALKRDLFLCDNLDIKTKAAI